jgi:two-component system, chemotaxis family, CheB/CheR fusion protein
MIEFYVKDTGIGIKEENLGLIFQRFRKLEDDKNQLHRGTGLGLAISSQLVHLLGGSITLKSTYGQGSLFSFTIPFAKANGSIDSDKASTFSDDIPVLTDVEILVAEDDISNYMYIEKLLKKTHALIHHALNGKEVLFLLKKHPEIKLVLMDIKMPVMDGIETLHEIRKMGIQIPIIAQTAHAYSDEVLKIKQEGFNDYISKPINPQDFYQKIRAAILNL